MREALGSIPSPGPPPPVSFGHGAACLSGEEHVEVRRQCRERWGSCGDASWGIVKEAEPEIGRKGPNCPQRCCCETVRQAGGVFLFPSLLILKGIGTPCWKGSSYKHAKGSGLGTMRIPGTRTSSPSAFSPHSPVQTGVPSPSQWLGHQNPAPVCAPTHTYLHVC